MSTDMSRVKVTLEQIARLISALDDLKQNVLPRDPQLFAVMAEGPLDDLQRMRGEICQYVEELQATA